MEIDQERNIDEIDTEAGEVHPLETLLDFLANPDNIADRLEDSVLTDISTAVQERVTDDTESMKEWKKFVDWAIEINTQTTDARTRSDGGSFENAANFKSPIMTKAALKWSDRSVIEMLRHDDLAKFKTENEDNEEVNAKGKRIAKHMNYQLNFKMKWRKSQRKMLYVLPNAGTTFKKTFFDSISGQNETSLILYPNFIVKNGVNINIDTEPFSEIISISKNKIIENQRSGIWIEDDLQLADEDKNHDFIEHHGFYDLDDDGYDEPYLITYLKSTGKIVRVTPRFEVDNVFVRNESGSVITIEELMIAIEESGQEPSFDGVEIVRIEPDNMITKYGFIPSPDGTFLDWGYFHILGHLTMLINSGTNKMLDAATLANMPSGFLSKAFRKVKNLLRFEPGEFKGTDLISKELHEGIYTFPFKGADPTLLTLVQDITAQAEQLASSVDLPAIAGMNTAASTILAILQETMVSPAAIIMGVYESMTEEFEILFKLNSKFTDPKEYQRILIDESANFENDYSEDNINILPTANPELASKMERIQQAEAALVAVPALKELGANVIPIYRMFYEAIGFPNVEEIFKPTEGQSTEAQRLQKQQQDLQQQQQDLQQTQLDQTERILAVQEQDQSRKDAETANKIDTNDVEQQRKSLDTAATALLKQAQTLLTTEQTETESIKNDIDIFTTQFKAAIDLINITQGPFNDNNTPQSRETNRQT